MRTHGWAGAPPANDAEARRRILGAAAACVDRDGAMQATLSDAAAELGVTRQTVYRYFPSTEQLFVALAEEAADEFIDRIVKQMRPHVDPAVALVEGLAFTIESIPDERYLGLLLRTGDAFTRGVVSDVAMSFGRDLLDRTDIDWDELGYDDGAIEGLVEIMLRLIQSLAVSPQAPSGSPRTGEELRAFLYRWFGPAVAGRTPTRVTPDRI